MMKTINNISNNGNQTKTLALTGGGTMGHISPNLTLLPELRKHFNKIIYIGGKNSMEEKKAHENNLPFFSIPTIKFNRRHFLKNLKIPFVLIRAKRIAKKILNNENVDLVFSKGGYVSLPVMLAAQKLKLPNILHESDMSLGLANKISSKKSEKVFISTKKAYETLPKKIKQKAVITGIPVSDKFLKENISSTAKKLIENKIQNNKKLMVVTGGSQGASAINTVIQKNLDILLKDYEIYHIVGSGKADKSIKKSGYHQLEFVSNMHDYFLASDVIISRAGATTIFEALKSESNLIAIPLPKSKSSRGDQVENAKYFNSLGLVDFIEQENFNIETLSRTLKNIEKNKEKKIKLIKKFNNSTPTIAEIAKIIADLHI